MEKRKIFLIAGETSGDLIGAKIIRSLKKKSANPLELIGIGGEEMKKEGLKSLFPMKELSVMGFSEVLPQIFKILGLIKLTSNEIIKTKPDVVITIDSPDFCFRVAKKVKKKSNSKLVHVVAPSVWAYRSGRAKKISRIFDHLLCLLPFEPPYFEKHALKTTFIGHPVIEDGFDKGNANDFLKKHQINEGANLLCLMPGSRRFEIETLLGIFEKSVEILAEKISDLMPVLISTERFKDELQERTRNWKIKPIVVSGKEDKINALSAAKAALAKSGTGTIEIAISGVPMVITYKVSFLSALIARMLLKIKFANLVNIIAEKEIIPELLQEKCQPQRLADELEKIISDKSISENQIKQAKTILLQLGLGKEPSPSEKAAEIILNLI